MYLWFSAATCAVNVSVIGSNNSAPLRGLVPRYVGTVGPRIMPAVYMVLQRLLIVIIRQGA